MSNLPSGTTSIVFYLSVAEKAKLDAARVKAGGKPMSEFIKGVLLNSISSKNSLQQMKDGSYRGELKDGRPVFRSGSRSESESQAEAPEEIVYRQRKRNQKKN